MRDPHVPPHDAASESAEQDRAASRPPRIGRYELLERIGEGGMGVVHLARQTEPIERVVALKLVRADMASAEVVARFQAERQALARMNHRGIARILDAGVHERRPYFVMEHVEGAPITTYCDEERLDLRARLELFRDVCAAVQHAHRRGILHRDLKSSNVLVTEEDGRPTPKVIDFGIAKVLADDGAAATDRTEPGRVLGTPDTMSPEQAGASAHDVDTRSDVYSLGVLLYELLSGTKPFDSTTVMQRGYLELLRTIVEVVPTRPSDRVLEEESSGAVPATRRAEDAASLSRRLRGDLDWIVLRALEKDPSRRYESPAAFARDVQRHLDRDPVHAAPPSRTYRLRKFVARRRGAVAAAGAIVTLFAAGAAGTGIGLVRTVRANHDLDEVATFQAQQLASLDAARMGASLRRALIEAADPDRVDALVHELAGLEFTDIALRAMEENLFRPTIESIDARFVDQPRVRARLLLSAGSAMRDMGLLDSAVDPTERALALRREHVGHDDADTLVAMNELGVLRRQRGDLEEAQRLLRDALERSTRSHGRDHAGTLTIEHNLALVRGERGDLEGSEAALRDTYERQRRTLGDGHPETLRSVGNIGWALLQRGRLDDAGPFVRAAYEGRRRELGDDHPQTLSALNNLGYLHRARGELVEAEACYRQALEGMLRVLGSEHTETLNMQQNVGYVLQTRGELEEAETFLRAALEGKRRVLGDDHPDTLSAINNMGALVRLRGRIDDAVPLYREALEGRRTTLGGEHPDTLGSMANMGVLLRALGRRDEAISTTRDAIAGMRTTLGDDHPRTLAVVANLGTMLAESGDVDGGIDHLLEALAGRRRSLGDEHPHTRASAELAVRVLRGALARDPGGAVGAMRTAELGAALLLAGDPVGAEATCLRALDRIVETGADPALLVAATSDLGAALLAQGRGEDAEPVLLDAAESVVDGADVGPGTTWIGVPLGPLAIDRVLGIYEGRTGDEDDAATWRAARGRWRVQGGAAPVEATAPVR